MDSVAQQRVEKSQQSGHLVGTVGPDQPGRGELVELVDDVLHPKMRMVFDGGVLERPSTIHLHPAFACYGIHGLLMSPKTTRYCKPKWQLHSWMQQT